MQPSNIVPKAPSSPKQVREPGELVALVENEELAAELHRSINVFMRRKILQLVAGVIDSIKRSVGEIAQREEPKLILDKISEIFDLVATMMPHAIQDEDLPKKLKQVKASGSLPLPQMDELIKKYRLIKKIDSPLVKMMTRSISDAISSIALIAAQQRQQPQPEDDI